MPREPFTITRPADMHCHFRQDNMLRMVVPATADVFGYAIAMPNTQPPITEVDQCRAYLADIVRAGGDGPGARFIPLGTIYLMEGIDPDELRRGYKERVWVAGKLYPKGGTTNAEHAAESIRDIYPLLEVMEAIGMLLLVHGEVIGPKEAEHSRWVRETLHVQEVMPQLRRDFPRLKIVREHISTRDAVEEVLADESGYLAATITPHHALLTDAEVSRNGLHVQANCLPIIKGPEDRAAIQAAMVSGDERFFAGTDSAPHDTARKFSNCCSFGAFVAPGALEAYAAVFEQHGAFEEHDGTERFERFMSLNGPKFYGLPPAPGKITMIPNSHGTKVTKRFIVHGTRILQPSVEVIALFHHELGLAPDFPYVVGSVTRYGE